MRLQQQVMKMIRRWQGGAMPSVHIDQTLEGGLAKYGIGAVLCDEQGTIRAVNHHFEALCGFNRSELVGRPAPALRSGIYTSTLLDSVLAGIEQHGLWQGRLYSRHKSGRLLAEQLTICRYQAAESLLLCLVGLSQQEQMPAQLEQQGVRMLDPLTGLLDRPGFYAELEQCCSHGMPFGLLSLDLKNFCQINTQFDHHTGDVLLQQLAERLRLLVGSRELIGRVGGDGFALLLPGLSSESQLQEWSEQVLRELHRAFDVGPRKLRLSGTLAGALWPRDGDDHHQLLRHADVALFEARRQQRDYFCFSAQMLDRIAHRERMQKELMDAISKNEIELAYQPIWDNRLGRVAKLEALARWTHREWGVISPVEFIPLAEQSGLIQAMGEKLLARACQDLKQLQAMGYDWLQISINRSTLEFNTLNPDGRDWLDVLHQHELAPSSFIFEITESIFMEGHEDHLQRIRALRSAGCLIAIDDFGTGFSALNYLRLYPMDLVKIDRSFVQQIPGHTQDRLLLKGLIDIVHNLGMQLVVEGIEREEQQAFICSQGCAYTQGFLFSKPLAWADLMSYLRHHHPVVETGQACEPTPMLAI
ncbi:putative bifunctional diguanylate cyclase/phosphodiesterase [Pseudaeromonas sharmana]|uniref:Bifunctional diguanylate cyclase/phosphodiesterase n=1 Tax=Pseudaeromonas sharmana TaxID=328412 RepID=A0ABV8CNI8_9GAMM